MSTVPARAPIVSRQQQLQRQRIYYITFAVIAALAVFTGFARTYFLKGYFGAPSLTPLVHLHGFIFTSWILMFIAQTSLVAAGRTDIHRKLGVVGGVLAGLMIIVGPLTAIAAARLGHSPSPEVPALKFLVIPLIDILQFAILIGAALYLRRKPEHHRRLMLAATIGILPAAFARFPVSPLYAYQPLAAFLMTDIVLLSAVTYDSIKHHRLHPAFAWSAALIILSFPLRLMLSGTNAWMTFAQWVTR
jgi:hypothetical protein